MILSEWIPYRVPKSLYYLRSEGYHHTSVWPSNLKTLVIDRKLSKWIETELPSDLRFLSLPSGWIKGEMTGKYLSDRYEDTRSNSLSLMEVLPKNLVALSWTGSILEEMVNIIFSKIYEIKKQGRLKSLSYFAINGRAYFLSEKGEQPTNTTDYVQMTELPVRSRQTKNSHCSDADHVSGANSPKTFFSTDGPTKLVCVSGRLNLTESGGTVVTLRKGDSHVLLRSGSHFLTNGCSCERKTPSRATLTPNHAIEDGRACEHRLVVE